jgi:hypothetical protein
LLHNKYYESDVSDVKDDEESSCSTDGGRSENHEGLWWKDWERTDHLQNGRTVFKYTLNNSERMWVGVDSAG